MKANLKSHEAQIFRDGFNPPEPPEVAGINLTADELAVYYNIVAAKANEDWTEIGLILAVQCAKTTVEIAKIRNDNIDTSPVNTNGRGAAVVALERIGSSR